jgi:hypothetical protein
VLWEECCEPEHKPVEPTVPEPDYVIDEGTGERIYGADSSLEAVEVWSVYLDKLDEYDVCHSYEGLHRTDRCWVRSTVEDSDINDQWELRGFYQQLITGPVEVSWENAGSLDDSYLMLEPYLAKEAPHADGETIHDPTDVRSA